MLNLTESYILSLPIYTAGAAIDKQLVVGKWSKLASNENPLGPSKNSIEAIKKELKNINIYPTLHRAETIKQICEYYKDFAIAHEHVTLGNGSTELIINLVKTLVGHNEIVMTGWPTFIMYRLSILAQGRQEIAVPLNMNLSYDLKEMARQLHSNSQIKMLFIANPNNPTGTYTPKNDLLAFINNLRSDIVLVLDEAYFEYVEQKDYVNGLTIALKRPRTVVLRTFSKIHALAGIRLGYAVGDKNIIAALNKILDPFSTNSLAQVAAIQSLKDTNHIHKSIEHNRLIKPLLSSKLRELGFMVNNSEGNFLLVKKADYMPSIANMYKQLFKKGVIIRPLDAYDMPDYMRISIGTQEQVEHLIKELKMIV